MIFIDWILDKLKNNNNDDDYSPIPLYIEAEDPYYDDIDDDIDEKEESRVIIIDL